MPVSPFIKKHLNPLSILAFVLMSISIYFIAFPGPEGWGFLGGTMLFMFFSLPTVAINTFIIWGIKAEKKRFIVQLICTLIIILIFGVLWLI